MFRIISGISSLVVLAILVVMLVGYFTPIEYKGEMSEFFIDRRSVVWQALTNVQNIPNTKPDVKSVEILSNDRGLLTWKEQLDRGGFRNYRIVEKREPYKYVINLFENSRKIKGTWTFTISQTNSGSIVKIEEVSENNNVWLRGCYTILGGDVLLQREMKILRVALFRRLIDTP